LPNGDLTHNIFSTGVSGELKTVAAAKESMAFYGNFIISINNGLYVFINLP
jgi:hypothetical protein